MTGLHHLALRTRDVPSLAQFYQAWFGLKVLHERLPRSLWLSLEGDAVLMIEAVEEGEPRVQPGTLELVALRVSASEREGLRERLMAAGLLEGETAHTLYFRDPDGRRVGASSYEFA
jgi:catechol 2,3-dioxygenase-like lactoylglutathione lyase family enzyme